MFFVFVFLIKGCVGGQVDDGGPRSHTLPCRRQGAWTVVPFPDRAVSLLELRRKELRRKKHRP